MEKKKKKFTKPIKDSILIAKNTRYTIEINEAQRSRCLMGITIQMILMCFLLALEIVYIAKGSLEIEIVALTITTIVLIFIVKGFQINSIIFIRSYVLKVVTNIEVLLLVLLIGFTILQSITKQSDWKKTILPASVILTLYIISAFYSIYIINKYILDYFSSQQDFGLKKSLMSQATFEANLRKSMASRTSHTPDAFAIQNQSSVSLPYEDNTD